MPSPTNDNYSVASGGAVYGGVPPSVTPLRSGGTVTMLVGSWAGSGFQQLSVGPTDKTIFRSSAHCGSCWDGDRKILWMFGADTHANEVDMDNAVYGWRASDGLFIKHYDADPTSGYRMDANGVYWSSAAHDKPWGTHTFRRLRWIGSSNEIEVVVDAEYHSYLTSIILENPAQTKANRKPPLWYYNVVTGKWRIVPLSGVADASFPATGFAYSVGYIPGYGWFTDDQSTWTKMDAATYGLSTASVYNHSIGYQNYVYTIGRTAYKVGGTDGTMLYSIHPVDNLAGSVRHLTSEYAALSGLTTSNMASAMMPDGRVIIFPISGTTIHALILDMVADTVTDTGYTFPGMDGTTTYFELACEWSAEFSCAIFLSRRFSPPRVIGFRP